MKLDDMELFVQVVKHGSFTKAADFCDLPKSTVSRRIRILEESLKTRLLERTTRRLILTEVGEAFFHKATQILEDVEETEKAIAHSQGDYSGKLTIYAPDCLLELCIDHVAKFCRDYPDLSLVLHSTSQPQQTMADKRFDLLIDVGSLADSSFIARPLATLQYDFFASPEYLENHGTPELPADLEKHPSLITHQYSSQQFSWNYEQLEFPALPKCSADSPYLVRALAVEGQGIGCLPMFMAAKEVQKNKLVRLFDGKYAFPLTIYGIYHSRRFIPNKVKLLLDDITRQLQARINAIEEQVS